MKKCFKTIIFFSAISLFLSASQSYASKVPLKLLATILGPDSSGASCVVMDLNTEKQSSCKIGDRVAGYQIAMITRGSVTLLKDGEFSFLNLPPGSEIKASNDDPKAIKIKKSFLQRKTADLNSLLNYVSPVPFIESGKIAGLMIPPVGNKATQYLLNRAGLREGDVATAVNGETVDSLKKALELYNKFKTQDKIEVEIRRGSDLRNLTYLFI